MLSPIYASAFPVDPLIHPYLPFATHSYTWNIIQNQLKIKKGSGKLTITVFHVTLIISIIHWWYGNYTRIHFLCSNSLFVLDDLGRITDISCVCKKLSIKYLNRKHVEPPLGTPLQCLPKVQRKMRSFGVRVGQVFAKVKKKGLISGWLET